MAHVQRWKSPVSLGQSDPAWSKTNKPPIYMFTTTAPQYSVYCTFSCRCNSRFITLDWLMTTLDWLMTEMPSQRNPSNFIFDTANYSSCHSDGKQWENEELFIDILNRIVILWAFFHNMVHQWDEWKNLQSMKMTSVIELWNNTPPRIHVEVTTQVDVFLGDTWTWGSASSCPSLIHMDHPKHNYNRLKA